MPKYKLSVIKYEENKNYEAQMASWKEKRGDIYGRSIRERDEIEPQPEDVTRSLDVVLTEAEYQKVKKEVITVFE